MLVGGSNAAPLPRIRRITIHFLPRRALGLLLAVLIPLSTVVHTGDEPGRASVSSLTAHHHGPHDPCPPQDVHTCFACSSHRLLASPASVVVILPTVVGLEGCSRVEGRSALVVAPQAASRGPPIPSASV